MHRGTRIRLGALAVFVAVQGVVPVWALIEEPGAHRTDFTWDMFAVRKDCAPCQIDYTIGDGAPIRLSWGLRAPDPVAEPDAYAEFVSYAGDAIIAHPSRPAVNVRAAPQVARLKVRPRLAGLGAAVCEELEATYVQALREPRRAPRWAAEEAHAWELSGRRLRVTAQCSCTYNNGPPHPLLDPEADLCQRGAP